jgi:hypothetical protein
MRPTFGREYIENEFQRIADAEWERETLTATTAADVAADPDGLRAALYTIFRRLRELDNRRFRTGRF